MIQLLLDNRDLFLKGFLNTILLFVLAGIGSLVLGVLLAAMRVSPVPALRLLGSGYVTIFRNTPLTLVFFFFAFAYPRLERVHSRVSCDVTPLRLWGAKGCR